MNKKIIYESIMSLVAKHVKNALNEYRTAAPEHNIDIADLKQFLKMTIQEWIYKKFTSIPNLTNKFRSFTYEPYGKLNLYIGSVYPNQPIKLTISPQLGYYNIREDLQKIKNILKNIKNLKLYLLKFKHYSKYKLNIILKRMMIYNLH